MSKRGKEKGLSQLLKCSLLHSVQVQVKDDNVHCIEFFTYKYLTSKNTTLSEDGRTRESEQTTCIVGVEMRRCEADLPETV